MPKDRIAVVIPMKNSKAYIRQCLGSVTAAIRQYGSAELVIVDGGSTDGSYEIALSDYGGLAKVVQAPGTISSMRNMGARSTQSKYISFIDSDCVIPVDYFDRVATAFSSLRADAIGCTYEIPSQPKWIERTWHSLHDHTGDGYVTFLNSGNFVVTRSAFETSGGFDETLITGEDAEYCKRMTQCGFLIYEDHRISATHLGNPKTLRAFFRKQAWHGLGMFGTFRLSRFDRPVLTTFLFLACLLAGIIALFALPTGLPGRIAFFCGSSLMAPLLTVIYRLVKGGSAKGFFRALVLYWVYFAARLYALFLILTTPSLRNAKPYRVNRSVGS